MTCPTLAAPLSLIVGEGLFRNRGYAATFGDHQRVCKVSTTPEACGAAVGLGRCPVRAQGVRCGLPTIRSLPTCRSMDSKYGLMRIANFLTSVSVQSRALTLTEIGE